MAAKTSSIPRFLLPQYGPMWRSAVRSAAFARAPNIEVGQVKVRYVSKTAPKRPSIANSVASKVAGSRAASDRAAAKAAKASAPTRPPSKTASASKPANRAPASEPIAQAAAPKPTSASASAVSQRAAPPKAVDPSKPLVLEKPERFNPPSHGARLPRSVPKHYGGPMTPEEVQAQTQRSYPGLPPPPNTWTHWFINSRGIHTFITLGTLTALTVYTFVANFRNNSPFADLLPPISEFPRHPFQYIGTFIHVVRMQEENSSSLTAEKRRRKIEDVTKREEYRKAHGLEPITGLFGAKAMPTPSPASAEDSPEPQPDTTAVATVIAPAAVAELPSEGRKKWLGIF
ncbi:hypothetical protein GGS21DRAFT_522808 [Xylaria nigripes]|nr:hypothetical protein GGS21DRAFT_522808 [Xylaria nigripes]